MVKRYTSGVMGVFPTNSYGILSGGMYSLSLQAQFDSTQWPQLAPTITYLVVAGGGGGAGSGSGLGRLGQGNNGGSALTSTSSPFAAAGGGGAGAAATTATSNTATVGGIGIYSTLAGSYLAGGGSGCGYITDKNPSDGGGRAAGTSSGSGINGTSNSGGGGGGAAFNGTGGTGGSGIVIISFPSFYANATATTGSPTITQSGGNTIYKFTSSGTITF